MTNEPTTVESARAGLDRALEDQASYLKRYDENLPTSATVRREKIDAVEEATYILQVATDQADRERAAELEALQGAVTTEIISDPRIALAGRQAILRETAAKVLAAFEAGAKKMTARDELIANLSAKATTAKIPEAITPSWASNPQHAGGYDAQPYRTGLLIGGEELLPEPPTVRQRRLSDAVLAAVTDAAGRQPYAESLPVTVARLDVPVQEARELAQGDRRRVERNGTPGPPGTPGLDPA